MERQGEQRTQQELYEDEGPEDDYEQVPRRGYQENRVVRGQYEGGEYQAVQNEGFIDQRRTAATDIGQHHHKYQTYVGMQVQ